VSCSSASGVLLLVADSFSIPVPLVLLVQGKGICKRKAADQAGNDTKLGLSATPGADAAVLDTPGRTPTPTPAPLAAPDAAAMLDAAGQQQQQQQPPGALDVLALVGAGTGDTVTDLQRILEVLVVNNHPAAVNVSITTSDRAMTCWLH